MQLINYFTIYFIFYVYLHLYLPHIHACILKAGSLKLNEEIYTYTCRNIQAQIAKIQKISVRYIYRKIFSIYPIFNKNDLVVSSLVDFVKYFRYTIEFTAVIRLRTRCL